MSQIDDIVSEISVALKKRGYKKNRLSWYGVKDRLTVVFAIQKSQYGTDTWCYSFGICLHDLMDGSGRSMNDCQVKYRVDHVINGVVLSPENIVKLIERWDAMYGDLALLRTSAVEGTLPGQCTTSALRYLSSVNLSNLHDKK